MRGMGKIKVLIVDDSPVFCAMASKGIGEDAGIEIAGTAGDPFEARDMILDLEPDVLVLDIELPRMDGLTFLRKLMPQYPLPTVVVSAHSDVILSALEAGAVDYVRKPSAGGPESVHTFFQELIVKIKVASIANVSAYKKAMPQGTVTGGRKLMTEKVIVIGSSTGGTEALYAIFKELPREMPGIVVVQHMPENFTKMYADRLNASCKMEVKEGEDGDAVMPGRIIIAPGGMHTKLLKKDGGYRIHCFQEDKVNGHRPSVDVLFQSAAKAAGAAAVGVILTGMGYDGARGMLEMRKQGAITIGQDEETCVVYGMPRVAFDIGGVTEQLPLGRIAQKLCSLTHS